ncbi:hypothetical protein N0B31_10250 [Salinirubellus salinus]|uniref:Uncharacterized protein n=1 Tax=Salinirubellus salinus TaxID=1364945 RepID=A0A9E7UA55_9EURY|nr:hypothetical protein [Salinirubellus salinus]UWM56656.1 hypothetical protein N0B31_10250 [Salinirubellus salinus]
MQQIDVPSRAAFALERAVVDAVQERAEDYEPDTVARTATAIGDYVGHERTPPSELPDELVLLFSGYASSGLREGATESEVQMLMYALALYVSHRGFDGIDDAPVY